MGQGGYLDGSSGPYPQCSCRDHAGTDPGPLLHHTSAVSGAVLTVCVEGGGGGGGGGGGVW